MTQTYIDKTQLVTKSRRCTVDRRIMKKKPRKLFEFHIIICSYFHIQTPNHAVTFQTVECFKVKHRDETNDRYVF